MTAAISHRLVSTNGVRLHVAEAGPRDGPLLLLLHGFPEFWYAWHREIEPLAAAGFRVVAPDQRGYNLSDKPRGIAAYRLDELVRDATGLIDEAGRERAFVAGHDWGGGVAWWLGVTEPRRLERLAIFNMPHPLVMQRNLRSNPAQRRRSRYILFHQLPWLPEHTLRKNDWARAVRTLTVSSRPGTFDAQDFARYREAWSQPGAATAMLNWYRAALRKPPPRPASLRVERPTMLVWGTEDRFLGQEMAPESVALCDQGRLELIPGATHWVLHEEPRRVVELLLDFFRRPAA